MLEKDMEEKLKKRVKELGGICVKLNCAGTSGMPDRLILLPHGTVALVELKTDKGVLTTLQEYTIEKINGLDILADVVQGETRLDIFINTLEMEMWRNEDLRNTEMSDANDF